MTCETLALAVVGSFIGITIAKLLIWGYETLEDRFRND